MTSTAAGGSDLEDELDDLDEYLDEFADDILSKPPGFDLAVEQELKDEQKQKDEEKNQAHEQSGRSHEEEGAQSDLKKQLEKTLDDLGHESQEARAQLEGLLEEISVLQEDGTKTLDAAGEEDATKNLKDTISSTLNRLRESGSKVDRELQEEVPSGNHNQQPDELLLQQLLSGLSLGGEGGESGGDVEMAGLLEEMLSQLASKDVLYEPLKDLSDKYPNWLDTNRTVLTPEDLARYELQAEAVRDIVAKFEEPEYSDTSKPHRDFISARLEDMQNAGTPPKELVGEDSGLSALGLGFGDEDVPPELSKDLEKGCEQM